MTVNYFVQILSLAGKQLFAPLFSWLQYKTIVTICSVASSHWHKEAGNGEIFLHFSSKEFWKEKALWCGGNLFQNLVIWDNSQLSLDVFRLGFKKKKSRGLDSFTTKILDIMGLFYKHLIFFSFLWWGSDLSLESPSSLKGLPGQSSYRLHVIVPCRLESCWNSVQTLLRLLENGNPWACSLSEWVLLSLSD